MTSIRTTSNTTQDGSAQVLAETGTSAMKTGLIAAVLAVFLAVGIGSDRANAHENEGLFQQLTGDGGGCDSNFRVTTASATCMTSGWSHMGIPPYWSIWAKNGCSDYGDIEAHVDVPNEADEHIHADESEKAYAYSTNEPRSVKCCVNKSDLCYRDQVEKVTSGDNEGKIRFLRISESNTRLVSYEDVSTHQARYDFCQTNPNYVYCKVNPDGDALYPPATPPSEMTLSELRSRPCGGEGQPACSCGDHICDRFDCEWNFNQSSASDTCYSTTSNSDGLGAPGFERGVNTHWCRVRDVSCRIGYKPSTTGPGGSIIWKSNSSVTSGYTWEFRRLKNCAGTLPNPHTDACNETTLIGCGTAKTNFPTDVTTSCTVTNTQISWVNGQWCKYTANCNDGTTGPLNTTTIHIHPLRVGDLKNCSGVLKHKTC